MEKIPSLLKNQVFFFLLFRFCRIFVILLHFLENLFPFPTFLENFLPIVTLQRFVFLVLHFFFFCYIFGYFPFATFLDNFLSFPAFILRMLFLLLHFWRMLFLLLHFWIKFFLLLLSLLFTSLHLGNHYYLINISTLNHKELNENVQKSIYKRESSLQNVADSYNTRPILEQLCWILQVLEIFVESEYVSIIIV